MDITEALNLVGVYKGRYQAFEKIEEVLTHASQAVNTLAAKQAELRDLETDINSLESEKSNLTKAISDLGMKRKSLEDEIATLETERAIGQQELKEELATAKADAEAAEAVRRQKAEDDLVAFERNADMRRRSLQDEILSLEGKRAAIATALEQALQPVKP